MTETVHDGQDHHDDCMYPTFANPESCNCAEPLLDEVWPQDEDAA